MDSERFETSKENYESPWSSVYSVLYDTHRLHCSTVYLNDTIHNISSGDTRCLYDLPSSTKV